MNLPKRYIKTVLTAIYFSSFCNAAAEHLPPLKSEKRLPDIECSIHSQLARIEAGAAKLIKDTSHAINILKRSFEHTQYVLYDVVRTCEMLYALNGNDAALELIQCAHTHYNADSFHFERERIVDLLKTYHANETDLIAFFEAKLSD